MKKKVLAVPCLIAVIILSACKKDNEAINHIAITPASPTNITIQAPTSSPAPTQTNISNQITPLGQDNNSLSPTPPVMHSYTDRYDIIRDGYNKGKDIVISYPQIRGLKDTDKQNIINDLLRKDAMSYLDDSSNLITLDISYEIEWKGNYLLSVRYYGWGEISDAPHPFKGYFTTNINMKTGKRINLKDVFHIDKAMVDSIKENSSYKGPMDPSDSNLMEEVQCNMGNLIVSDFSDINFYFTWDSLGILIDMSHSVGGYAMIETKYSDLISAMNSENNVWKDFEGFQSNETDNISSQY